MIQFLIQVHCSGKYDTNNNSSGSVGDTPSSKSQAMLTMGDDPNSHRRLAVLPLDTLLRNLAI